ncbi:MAG TPA: prevent-host-death family protein [Bryobacteraceae bacterium]|jgi:antitoxin (DNA-binding transcriptional repressor) of toxin-antitoxin stability system|nr:prevent-host-death family protein [Bryobacteraceae bacterium]
MKHQTVSVTEFKAKCLALLNQIGQEGGTLTVTKRGRPLATVGPVKRRPFRSSEGILAGKVKIVGDIVNADFSDLYEVVTNPDRVLNPEKYR